jgi:hypothetical protein
MFAKRFFLICGGVLMLAIACRVAVPPAHAQSAASADVCAADLASQGLRFTAAVIGRTFYVNGAPYGAPLPGSSKAIYITQCDNCGGEPDFLVMLDNGDMWHTSVVSLTWQYEGNAIGAAGPTAVHPVSFGALKARYR